MAAYLRLRQICLVAPALAPAVEDIIAVLGTPVVYRDPNVAKYGLENALFALGADILEVVAPTQPGTAAGRFLERSGGRGGYMAILDCDDVERRQAHAEAMGVKVASLIEHDGYLGVQLHPRDCRAAMVEFNRTEGGEDLAGPYHPAGHDWPQLARPGALPRLLATELESPDPAGLAAHWGRLLELPVQAGPCLRLPGSEIRFRDSGVAGGERMSGLTLGVAEPAQLLAIAQARGLLRDDGTIWLSGIRLALEKAQQDRLA